MLLQLIPPCSYCLLVFTLTFFFLFLFSSFFFFLLFSSSFFFSFSYIFLISYVGGKINDVPLDETAYCSRKSRYLIYSYSFSLCYLLSFLFMIYLFFFFLIHQRFGINIEVRWDGAEEKEREKEREAAISWARALYAKLSPFKSNTTYINFDVDVCPSPPPLLSTSLLFSFSLSVTNNESGCIGRRKRVLWKAF